MFKYLDKTYNNIEEVIELLKLHSLKYQRKLNRLH